MYKTRLVEFLQALQHRHAKLAPAFGPCLLSFVCTCGAPGRAPATFVRRLKGIRPSPIPSGLEVLLEPELPIELKPRECISVSFIRPDLVQGFQVKTVPHLAWAGGGSAVELKSTASVLTGQQVFTVHHTPHTANFFEKVPFDEVRELLSSVSYGVAAVGEDANVSPRYVLAWELVSDGLVLFHGDAKINKTHLNLRKNPVERRVVIDLDTLRGYAMQGTISELKREENPVTFDRVQSAFLAAGYGAPTRVQRSHITEWEPISAV